MARRQNQMLGDPMLDINCEEYKPLPVGYANAKFVGMAPNPYLSGVKTPKYQVSAPRPQSADVMAVNMAQRMPVSNRAASARDILNYYIKEGKEWQPPPVDTGSAEKDLNDLLEWVSTIVPDVPAALSLGDAKSKQEFLEDYYGLVSGPRPTLFRGSTRGQMLHKQTIATDVEPEQSSIDANKYLAKWNTMDVKIKNITYYKIQQRLQREGVNMDGYTLPTGYVQKHTLDGLFNRILQVIPARGVNIDMDSVFGITATEQAMASADPHYFSPSAPARTVSEGAGTSTDLSHQGTALAPTTQTTAEVQKK